MKVLTIGTWDILHWGHINFLQGCEALGELIVGVNSDRFVTAYKGAPIMNEDERCWALDQLGYDTALNDSAGRELIEEVGPDILAIGTDWGRKPYLEQIDVDWNFLETKDIILAYLPYTKEISTNIIKQRVNERSSNEASPHRHLL
jgi:cytidyltransferase-like protein